MAEKSIAARGDVKFAELSAVVTPRAETCATLGVPEGTRIDLGVLATTETPGLVARIKRALTPETPEQSLARRFLAVRAEEMRVEEGLTA